MPELAINAVKAPRLPRTEMNLNHPYFLRATQDFSDRSHEKSAVLRSKYNTRDVGGMGTTGLNTTNDEIEEIDESSHHYLRNNNLNKPRSATNTNYHSKVPSAPAVTHWLLLHIQSPLHHDGPFP